MLDQVIHLLAHSDTHRDWDVGQPAGKLRAVDGHHRRWLFKGMGQLGLSF